MRENTKPTAVQEAAERMDLGGILVARWAGAWIDFIALALLVAGPALTVNAIGNGPHVEAARLALVIGGILALLYFPVLEGFFGRTLGKLVTGLRVVDKRGRAPGIGRALLRTLFRIVEVNPFLAGGIPAGISVLVTKRKRRIGDLAAGTYVLGSNTYAEVRGAQNAMEALGAFD